MEARTKTEQARQGDLVPHQIVMAVRCRDELDVLQLPADLGHWAILSPDAPALPNVLLGHQGLVPIHADAAPRRESGGGLEEVLFRSQSARVCCKVGPLAHS